MVTSGGPGCDAPYLHELPYDEQRDHDERPYERHGRGGLLYGLCDDEFLT